jgi:hypothetical protein
MIWIARQGHDAPTPDRDSHHDLITALIARRDAYAAYGRALMHVDYTEASDVRDARLAAARAAIVAASGDVAVALDALEAVL